MADRTDAESMMNSETGLDLWRDVVEQIPERAKKTASLAQSWQDLMMGLALVAIRVFTILPELALHRLNGIRTLTPVSLVLSIVSLVVLGVGDFVPYIGRPTPFAAQVLAVAAFGLFIYRRVQAGQRLKRGEPVHSRGSAGTILPIGAVPWILDDQWRALKFAEPAILIAVGLILRFIPGWSLGSYFILCGLAMHAKCLVLEYRERSRVLDMLDQRIEMEHLNDAIEHHDSRVENEHGWVVPVPAPAC